MKKIIIVMTVLLSINATADVTNKQLIETKQCFADIPESPGWITIELTKTSYLRCLRCVIEDLDTYQQEEKNSLQISAALGPRGTYITQEYAQNSGNHSRIGLQPKFEKYGLPSGVGGHEWEYWFPKNTSISTYSDGSAVLQFKGYNLDLICD